MWQKKYAGIAKIESMAVIFINAVTEIDLTLKLLKRVLKICN